jgi:hypothetical protein
MCACLVRAYMLADRLAMLRLRAFSYVQAAESCPDAVAGDLLMRVVLEFGSSVGMRHEEVALNDIVQARAQSREFDAVPHSNDSLARLRQPSRGGPTQRKAARGFASAR